MEIHLKLKSGTFATARFVKSRELFRITYHTPGGPALGGWFSEDEIRHCRRLKNKPTRAQVQRAGWGFNGGKANR